MKIVYRVGSCQIPSCPLVITINGALSDHPTLLLALHHDLHAFIVKGEVAPWYMSFRNILIYRYEIWIVEIHHIHEK